MGGVSMHRQSNPRAEKPRDMGILERDRTRVEKGKEVLGGIDIGVSTDFGVSRGRKTIGHRNGIGHRSGVHKPPGSLREYGGVNQHHRTGVGSDTHAHTPSLHRHSGGSLDVNGSSSSSAGVEVSDARNNSSGSGSVIADAGKDAADRHSSNRPDGRNRGLISNETKNAAHNDNTNINAYQNQRPPQRKAFYRARHRSHGPSSSRHGSQSSRVARSMFKEAMEVYLTTQSQQKGISFTQAPREVRISRICVRTFYVFYCRSTHALHD